MIDPFRHFVAIADAGTFTAASKKLHLSQPALTASVQRLEAQVGGALFVRGRAGAELTAAGRALLPHARAAIVAAQEGARAVAEVMGAERGEVRLGAGMTAITYLLPPLIGAFRRKHPKLALRMFERGQDALLEALDAGEIDLAVAVGPVAGADRFHEDELVLVHAPSVDPKTSGFLTFPVGTATRAALDRTFPGAPIVMELASASAIKGQLRAGLGVALISRLAVATDLELGRLVLAKHKRMPIRRELVLAHRGVSRLSPAARAMRAVLLAQRG